MADLSSRQLTTEEKRALLAQLLRKQGGLAATTSTKPDTTLVPDIASRHEPFPLTDVQRAYWLGRGNFFELGQVSCHAYAEYDLTGADLARIQAAWQTLVDRHDMLRAIVREDGLQRILPEVPDYQIEHLDLRGCDPAQAEMQLAAIRNRMSHQVVPADRWPLFELRTSGLDRQTILHLSLDLLVFDFWSIQLLINEWQKLVLNPDLQLAPLAVSFRDYALAAAPRQDSASYRAAEAYWRQRLESLPPPPSLPLAKSPSVIARPRFARRQAVLERALWQRLKTKSANAGLTPSITFITAFARILGAWSRTPDLCLNLTLFNRLPLHPQVNQLVGDFTSILLLEVHAHATEPFPAMAKTLASRLWSDLEHRAYGGVRLLQEMAKRDARQPSMPVVFTSTLGNAAPIPESPDSWRGGLGNVLYSVTQTPQVWLDHQLYEQDGRVYLIWDALEELFPPGLLDDMFAAYCGYVRRLAEDAAAWSETSTNLVPPAQLSLRAAMNDTAAAVPAGLMHEPFLDQVRARPHQTAVVTPDRSLSYASLDRRAQRLARRLRRMGTQPNRLVAVVMEKGWEQVVGVLAVLEAGGAYLAVDPDLPQERRWLLLQRGEVDIVLTQSGLAARLDWPAGVQCVSVDREQDAPDDADDAPLQPVQSSDDLAYVIFTSGSTGEPKGVMVEHRSALNTILDINERFAVGPADRILALSSLSFDLSVYDIFGALAAGATIVMPPATSSHEPRDWTSLVVREGVTIWNSVPALLEMLVDHVGDRQALLGNSLRLALLSGDWIPVGLPDRARALVEGLQVVSLGGATEASIWSILHPVGTVDRDWASIPYGRPLRNQHMHVLNDAMEPCPTWVPGQLFIGGIGLARGYWRDTVGTDARFVIHPRNGERLYRTGDLGRYLPDGNIEFLGREDQQVKVQGYRIELGEIEAHLARHPGVKAAVVTTVGERAGPKHLAAYVVADALPVQELTDYLGQRLPGYMVPAVWHKLDALPLTANGKVDRKALRAPIGQPPAEPARSEGQTGALSRITALISEELGLAALDLHQNLLTIGATSLDLVSIVQRLDKEFGFVLSFQEFFRQPTVAALAGLIEQQRHKGIAKGDEASAPAAPRRTVKLILDPAAREAFHHENHAIRESPAEFGTLRLPREQPSPELEQQLRRRRAVRSFLPAPVPLAALGAWLAELSRNTVGGAAKYAYGSAGGCYPVQTYLHAKHNGIAGCPAGTFYYHPIEHRLVPLTLGAELDASIHEPFTNRPIFEQARFSLYFVNQPRAIEPIYGELAWRFSLIEAGAMAHALESSAWRFSLGVCPIGWLDFPVIRGLFHLEEGQELLHAHVGGLVDALPDVGDWEEGVV